jgi:hypothetical protein
MPIRVLDTGLIYRNPKPHVHSVHAYFPSVARLAHGELLCSFVLGEAFEAANCHTHVARSRDGGKTWELEGPICEGPKDRLTSDGSRLTALPGGEVVAFMVRSDRTDHPEEGLTNPETLGFVPTETLLVRSRDSGRTWSEPQALVPPLVGPSFELCCPIVPLSDGRWLLPTSTWRGWDGDCPNGMKMVAFVSHDRGGSWPEYLDVMADPGQRVIYWESKIAELAHDRLLAVAWVYDQVAGKDLPNQYAVSRDGGKSWSAPRSTGLQGQTLTPYVLDDAQKDSMPRFSGHGAGSGRVLCVYRRIDQPGLWANLSHLEGDAWVNDGCEPLWGASAQGLTGVSASMVENFQVLRFGAPSIAALGDGIVFVAFWCYEACVSVIRWFKLQVA